MASERDANSAPNSKQRGTFRRVTGATFSWLNPFALKSRYKMTGTQQAVDDGAYVLGLVNRLRVNGGDASSISEPCPSCGEHTLHLIANGGSIIPPRERIIEADGVESYNSSDTHPVIRCENCGYSSLAIDLISTEKYTRFSANMFRAAAQLWWCSIGAAVLGSLFALYEHSVLTLVSILFLSSFMLLKSLSFRYRAWQYAHKRLYEDTPPLGDWLAWEKKHLTS